MIRCIKALYLSTVFLVAQPGLAEQESNELAQVKPSQTEKPPVAPNVNLKEVTSPPVIEPPPLQVPNPEEAPLPLSKPEGLPVKEHAGDEFEKFIILGSEVPPATATRLPWSPKVTI